MVVVVSVQVVPDEGFPAENAGQAENFVFGDDLGHHLGPGPENSDLRVKARA